MKNKFKVGDRVNVYGGTCDVGLGQLNGAPGTIERLNTSRYPGGDGFIGVKLDGTYVAISIHPKQCRRLKKRTPAVFYALQDPESECLLSDALYTQKEAAEEHAARNITFTRVVKLKVCK